MIDLLLLIPDAQWMPDALLTKIRIHFVYGRFFHHFTVSSDGLTIGHMGHVPWASRLRGASRPPPPKKNEKEEGEEEEKKKNKKKKKGEKRRRKEEISM